MKCYTSCLLRGRGGLNKLAADLQISRELLRETKFIFSRVWLKNIILLSEHSEVTWFVRNIYFGECEAK